MTRFSAPAAFSGVASRQTLRVIRRAANDNTPPVCAANDAQALTLREAIRLFSAHGLSAAACAGQFARQAAARGDEHEFTRWLAVCRTLDPGLARELAARRRRGAL